MAVLSPYRHWGRIAIVTFAVGVAVYAIGSSPETLADLESSKLVNSGVVRSNTLDQRANLMSESLPLLTDSPSHFVWGRGFNSLEAPAGLHDSSFAATPDLWITHHGPNNDYIRAWLEQGVIGLGMLILWLLGSLLLGIRTCLQLPAGSRERLITAGLTASTFAYIIGASGHDVTHNVAALSAGALITGTLVGACTLFRSQSAVSVESNVDRSTALVRGDNGT